MTPPGGKEILMNAMDAIAFVAERKIEEALAEGQFDNLPGMGKPLEFDDLSHLPPDMRMAYTILKNSGYLAQSADPGKMAGMRDLLAHSPEEGRTYGRMQRLKILMTRVRRDELRRFPERAAGEKRETEDSPYLEKLLERM
jgi:hypothetical protein